MAKKGMAAKKRRRHRENQRKAKNDMAYRRQAISAAINHINVTAKWRKHRNNQ